ncbi:MAG TPA: uroporphyrinogen-III C-methyltransferase [Blastocatellia bacterium]|nr:uroporphyrinogen-III C-methyltransferase [Blastocatellia bacterium]HCX31009.1 uroporphyrinogen-III C-methyltransferase [Blastocatellia bacterium]
MKDEVQRGVLVVGHGSRRAAANVDVREAAVRIGERGGFVLVEPAFLEIEHPNIAEGFARLVQRGARDITVHPYFLSPGRHTRGDIPVEVSEAASRHPGINYRITEPLSAHPLVIEASVERIFESIHLETYENAPGALHLSQVRYRAERGTVYLVGAGPGDPGLLTLKALALLESCDTLVYDYLVNPELLSHVNASAERIYVGKVGGGRHTPQRQINHLLVQHARAGKRVVRLKGGDPFLFGRGGEEAEALVDAGIPFEVVPGISSALAVPAYAGIPLTHRGMSSSVAVITGARGGDGAYESGAVTHLASADTVVVLMGVAHLREIAKELVNSGRSAETPAAVIRWGTYNGQQTVKGTLGTIAEEAECAGMRAPAVIIIGEVVRLRERLNWFEQNLSVVGEEELEATMAVAC